MLASALEPAVARIWEEVLLRQDGITEDGSVCFARRDDEAIDATTIVVCDQINRCLREGRSVILKLTPEMWATLAIADGPGRRRIWGIRHPRFLVPETYFIECSKHKAICFFAEADVRSFVGNCRARTGHTLSYKYVPDSRRWLEQIAALRRALGLESEAY